MSIDKESDIAANLQIGPTTLGMVRIYVEAEGVDLPLDFEPEEAEEIAEELLAAAKLARGAAASSGGGDGAGKGGKASVRSGERSGPKGGGRPRRD
jgi:hypothetical protein